MPAVTFAEQDDCALITLNDNKYNVLTLPIVSELLDALKSVAASTSLNTVILQGNGKALSVGLDTKTVLTGGNDADMLLGRMGEVLGLLYLSDLRSVTIASGNATAAGAMLLLASDHRIGWGDSGKIGLSEVRFGLDVPAPTQQLIKDRLSVPFQYQATALAQLYDYDTACRAGYLDLRYETAEQARAAAIEKAAALSQLDSGAYLKTKQGMRSQFARLMAAN